jgi:4-amino-4-deoxy-L-arabinose transferase-like glycosyltransferase
MIEAKQSQQVKSRFSTRQYLAALTIGAFAFRVAGILLQHTYRFRTSEDHFGFGYETGRIARSLVLGQGFSNPFHGITGPTAWEAPLYPYVVAGVFRLTGIYTQRSALLLLCLNSLFSALTVVPIYLIARKVFGNRVALWSACVWAVFPYAMTWAIRWVWETSLTGLMLATAFWLALEIADADKQRLSKLWILFGLLWGLIALTNPSCLMFLPFAGCWCCYQLWRQKKPWFLVATASGLLFFAMIAPWEIRNYRVFHELLPMRGNGGAELRLGNGPGAVGIWMMGLHPTQNSIQLDLYREMGEARYVKMRQDEALAWLRSDYLRWARLILTKAIYYWAGTPNPSANWVTTQGKNSIFLAWAVLAWWGLARMIRQRKPAAFLFATMLLFCPLPFYITFTTMRYRHPIEPVMLILAVFLVSEAREFQHPAHQPQ